MTTSSKLRKIGYSSILISLLFGTNLSGTTLRDAIEQTINKNPDIRAEHYNKKENRMGIDEKKSGFKPKLDFKISAEHHQTDKYPTDGTADSTTRLDGINSTLKFEQSLFNGKKVFSEVNQAKHKYNNVKYTSDDTISDTILEVTNTYLDLVLNQSLKAFGDFKIVAHNYYLKLAKDKEEVSGEILDRLQVEAKIQALIDSNLDQDVKAQKSLSAYTKLTGSKISGNICRPILNEELIPKTLDDAIETALKTNKKLKAQYELIQEQKAKIAAAQAKFMPDLKLQLSAEYDKDLALLGNGEQERYKAMLVSSWNLYKGGADSATLEKERIKMLKERKKLDSIKNQVIDDITGTYKTYFQLKKRLENLKQYVDTNNKIVDVYREQLKEGSRTFLDLLNAETEVFRTRIMLETEGINLYREYFKILRNLNKLSDTVLAQPNQICKKFDVNSILPNYDKQYKDNEAELDKELEKETQELGLGE